MRRDLFFAIVILQITLCCDGLCCTTVFKHVKDVGTEGGELREQSVMVSFLLWSQGTARGNECSPTDLVESKEGGRRGDHKKGKKGREQKI